VSAISQTSYTNENIAFAWLDYIIKHVDASPTTYWCLLVLDSHISDHQDDFILKCHENHIVPLCFHLVLQTYFNHSMLVSFRLGNTITIKGSTEYCIVSIWNK